MIVQLWQKLLPLALSILQVLAILSVLAGVVYYWKRSKWNVLKTRKIVYYDRGLK